MLDTLIDYIYIILASLLAIILHEIAHGLVSYALGDPTPKEDGRFTLNPLKHLDLTGIICMIFFHIGWAKPVRVNPQYYKKPKLGITLVSLAGPVMNIILAVSWGFIYVLNYKITSNEVLFKIINTFSQYSLIMNIGLGLFNLIPLPPLDGSKIIGIFIPDSAYDKYMSYQKYGYIFIIVLVVVLNALSYLGMPSIINQAIQYFVDLIVNFWYVIL